MALGPAFDDVLAAARTGAAWALQRLYEDLAGTVTGYLRLRGATDADDVTSEAFLSIFRSLHAFEGDEAAFRSWVFTIVHHRLIDERRRADRRPRTESVDEVGETASGDVEREALDRLGGTWVQEVLGTLSAEQREVLLLRIVADLSVEDVADILGKRAGAVRALQYRGIRSLRRQLDQRGSFSGHLGGDGP